MKPKSSPTCSSAEAVHRESPPRIAFLAPTQIIKMLEEFVPGEYDLSSLRAICFGGAPIYVEHLRNAIKAFGPVFTQLYGQGESPITITGMSAAETARMAEANDPRIGSTGTIRTDVEARVVDENDNELPPGQAGEVVVRGDIVMMGYWNNPEATAETMRNGWLHTGDIGSFDENGYLFLLDRAKDMVISGGHNVYPREVEEVLLTHPAVAEVSVIGRPDAEWGESLVAYVVARQAVEPAALDAHCLQHIARYKRPKAYRFVEALPKNNYGKVLKTALRERLGTLESLSSSQAASLNTATAFTN